MASHDLQAPIRRVRTFIQLALGQTDLSDRSRQLLDRSERSTQRMHALIVALLAYARAGDVKLESQTLGVRWLLDTAVKDLDLEMEEAGATLVLPDTELQVQGPSVLLPQVFFNLFSNALKFRDPARPLVVALRAAPEGDEVRFEVEDNGVGVDPQHAERIFAPFERLHTQDEVQGTGLGLATVRRLVGRCGGRVTATGVPGVGATFTVWLPGAPAPTP